MESKTTISTWPLYAAINVCSIVGSYPATGLHAILVLSFVFFDTRLSHWLFSWSQHIFTCFRPILLNKVCVLAYLGDWLYINVENGLWNHYQAFKKLIFGVKRDSDKNYIKKKKIVSIRSWFDHFNIGLIGCQVGNEKQQVNKSKHFVYITQVGISALQVLISVSTYGDFSL